jgi:hypothetical protein
MEIEELQATWTQMSKELEKQKKLTDRIIMEMTQQKYVNKFQKIATYETIGAIICFITAIYLIYNFNKLDTWYLLLCGIVTLTCITVLPILSLRLIGGIKGINITESNYKDTLLRYNKAKKKLLLFQQFTVYASFALMFTTLPVASKILSNKDFFLMEKDVWLYGFIGIVMVFLFFFARWGYGCYRSITNSAENLLKELD